MYSVSKNTSSPVHAARLTVSKVDHRIRTWSASLALLDHDLNLWTRLTIGAIVRLALLEREDLIDLHLAPARGGTLLSDGVALIPDKVVRNPLGSIGLKASVSARRRYENKVKTDPALLEAHRKRARESWRRKQQAAQHETKGPESEATQQAAVAKKLSFTLKV